MAGSVEAAHAHGHHEVKHPYHIVDPSPWPAVGSGAALLLTVGGVMYHSLRSTGLPILARSRRDSNTWARRTLPKKSSRPTCTLE